MCGIAGLVDTTGDSSRDRLGAIAGSMATALTHRGPDSGASWVHDTLGIAFGHRRLAIIDLSPDGAQPMHRRALTITFNGEIYNYLELRAQLEAEGARFVTHSDTEVLLASIECWGVKLALERVVGMFAFGLWNQADSTLTLGRDRFGEKPLYVCQMNGRLAFASELSALRTLPWFKPTISRAALDGFLRRGCVSGPGTIFDEVRQIEPGTATTYRVETSITNGATIRYWSLDTEIEAARARPFSGSRSEAADELERLLTIAVRRQAIADVPLGCFLSGGIDSSTISALLQTVSSSPIKTFTIGSDGSSSEADEASAVARHLGTDHTSLIVRGKDALEVVPMLGSMYDEPFADSSQIPTFLVARLARKHVTVALSGDAGDEVFGGYNRHIAAATTWPKLSRIPVPIRSAAGRAAIAIRPNWWDALEAPLAKTGRWKLKGGLGNRVHKSARVLGAPSTHALHEALTTQWPHDLELVEGTQPTRFLKDDGPGGLTPAESMMRLDTHHYLVDDILTKVDRAAMATSLETRVPFLDPAVFRFAWTLPQSYRIGGSVGKLVVRDVLERHVPRPLFERPKSGFAIPLGDWLRGALRPWAEELLTTQRLAASGLGVDPIRKAWNDHFTERRNVEHGLWHVLMYLAWEDAQRA